jgi:hypothetical protein
VAVIEAFGKGPDRRATSGNRDWDIRNPMGKVFMHFGIVMSETPIGDKVMRSCEIVVIWAKSLARRG